jgi:hypothetical protein
MGTACDHPVVGFDLRCVFSLDTSVFALFDKVIPGGSGYALETHGVGLPDGWVLPVPWELEYGVGGELGMAEEMLRPADLTAWRGAAGVPDEPDPLDAFDDTDLRLGSLLSLAAPAMLVNDVTVGGVLGWEYAALFVGGRLLAAYGIDFPEKAAFELDSGTYRAVDPAGVAPTTRCAELLDTRFRGRFLFDGYLPREAKRYGSPHRPAWSGPAPRIDPAWRRLFPLLAGQGSPDTGSTHAT